MKNNGEKMKKLKTVLLGAGNRGLVYADYALSNPDKLEIIGVIEVNKDNRKEAKNRYSLNDDAVFDSLDNLLRDIPGIGRDLEVIAAAGWKRLD